MFKANSKHCGLPARAEKPLPHLAWVGQDVFWGRERKRVRLGLLSLLGRGALGRRSLGRAWLHNPDKAGHAGVEPPHGHLLLYEAAPAAHDNLEIKRRTRKKKKKGPRSSRTLQARTHTRASKQANKLVHAVHSTHGMRAGKVGLLHNVFAQQERGVGWKSPVEEGHWRRLLEAPGTPATRAKIVTQPPTGPLKS